MQSDRDLILPPREPTAPTVTPQPAMQPAPSMQQPIPDTSFQNVYLAPMQHAPFAEGYAHRRALLLGWAQITIGILCIIFQCAAIGAHTILHESGQGIWCGIFFLITGTFGVASAKKKTKSLVITFMVLSIVSVSLFFVSALVLTVIGLSLTSNIHNYFGYDEATGDWEILPEALHEQRTSYALTSIQLILAVAELVFGIWSATICCAALCCRKKTGLTAPIQYTVGAGPQVIMMTQQGAQIPMQVAPQGMPGQQQFTSPPMYDAGGPPMYEQNDMLPFKA